MYFIFGPNTGGGSNEYLLIRTGSTYEQVRHSLKQEGFVSNMSSFDFVARRAGYPSRVHPGRYHIYPGMSNWAMVRMLRAGRQTPVNLVIVKLRTINEFIKLVSSNLEADSAGLRFLLHDSAYLAGFGLTQATALCGVFPATYQFYWNTSADKAFRKIERGYQAFWTEPRKAAAQQLGLTPQTATVLASIVEEESNRYDEQPKIASVYLNRLKQGMKLQADPTARWAAGDFSIKRITSAQTSIASPYNTYYAAGLPPGPICTPAPKTLEAVLAAPSTNYLYFCAKEDFSGYHRFAATYAAHQQNARLYQDALNARNIH